ncbi:MAG: type III pantothenate kinase [Planctomycetota bacterium]
MNIIAVDIGNTNITVGLFLNNQEESVRSIPGSSLSELTESFNSAWQQIPIAKRSKEKRRNGVIVVSSVKPAWTKAVTQLVKENLGERVYIIGKDIPLPITLWLDEPDKIGTDRVVSAAAAYDVVQDAVVIADFGTAVTIDLVDHNGIFQGGVICPGFEISAKALKQNTAQLPEVQGHQTERTVRQDYRPGHKLWLILFGSRHTAGGNQTLRRENRQMAPDCYHRGRRRIDKGRLRVCRLLRSKPRSKRHSPGL